MDYPDIQPMIDGINTAAGIVVSAICLAGLILLVAWYTLGRVRHYRKTDSRGGLAKGLFLGLLATVEAGFLVLIVGFLPGFLTDPGTENAFPNSAFIRWFLLYLTIPLITYLLTRKHSGLRGLVSTTLLLSIALFGWFYEKWIGILLISIPIYLLLAHLLYHMAQIILPASDPEDRKESRKKFFALLYFTLGLQYPFWSAGSRVARETEKRISGDYFNGLFEPGTVWTHSHQVVGISAGIEFHQVEGPGIVFTRTYDRPGAVIDLRTQLRTVDFEATTKDGIPIRPALFISFCLDK
ncbi:MAG: hypothetical protein FJZ96_06895, partial [Chloroflexi bacterium]|nr:hypothetical protein [Chloroflexota bacterium]